jgi:hypothetical protein
MSVPVTIVASGGIPATESANGAPVSPTSDGSGVPITLTADGRGWPVFGSGGGTPTLQTLTLSNTTPQATVPWTATIQNRTIGSTITATSSDGTVLTVSGSTVSGTFSGSGTPTITLTETLAGAIGSPKPSTVGVTVSAAPVTLNALTFSPNTATAGTAWTSTITGKTSGSTITATSSDGTPLTVSGTTISGTFSASGTPTITLTETLAGATNSPRPSTGSVTVAAAVSNFASDSFAGTSGTALAGQALTSGGNWTNTNFSPSGAVSKDGSGGVYSVGSGAEAIYYANGNPPSADYTVQATLNQLGAPGNSTSWIGIGARVSTNGDGYFILYSPGGANLILYSIIGGTESALGTYSLPSTPSNLTIALKVTGTTIQVIVNGTTQISVTNGSITAAGHVGVYGYNSGSPTSGAHISALSAHV